MGFGMHAGKAVQGAIGSERKLDATYVGIAVDRTEYLESATKKYGLDLLMSGAFHGMLPKSSQRRCRRIDRIALTKDQDDDASVYKSCDSGNGSGGGIGGGGRDGNNGANDVMELYTFDICVKYLNAGENNRRTGGGLVTDNNGCCSVQNEFPGQNGVSPPSGPIAYDSSAWLKEDIRRIRMQYSDGKLRRLFGEALGKYCEGRWIEAKVKFQRLDDLFGDNPSRYFLERMERADVPPPGFDGYGSP